MSSLLWLAATAAAASAAPAAPPVTAEELLEAARDYYTVTPPRPEPCPQSSADEIVVCRELLDPETQKVPSDTDQGSGKDYIPRAPDVSGLPDCSSGCIRVGKKPRDPLIIDLKAIPEAPPGSDADRIGKGEAAGP